MIYVVQECSYAGISCITNSIFEIPYCCNPSARLGFSASEGSTIDTILAVLLRKRTSSSGPVALLPRNAYITPGTSVKSLIRAEADHIFLDQRSRAGGSIVHISLQRLRPCTICVERLELNPHNCWVSIGSVHQFRTSTIYH